MYHVSTTNEELNFKKIMLTGLIFGIPTNYSVGANVEDFDEHEAESYVDEEGLIAVQWAAYQIVAPALLVAGLIGNILALFALSSASLSGVTYVYLSGLAAADTGVVIFWMPMAARLGYDVNSYYLVALYYAHVELVAVNTFMATSIFIMACLTVDRYSSVFLPGRLRSGHSKRNAHLAILVSFVVGFLVSLPLGATRTIYEQQDGPDVVFTLRENTSVTATELWAAYLWMVVAVVHFAPASVLLFLNGCILKKFIQLTTKRRKFHAVSDKLRASQPAETSSLTRNRGYREEQHLVILLTAIIVLFFLATTPSVCIIAWRATRRDFSGTDYHGIEAFANVSELSNYALKFCVFLGCSTEFRDAVARIFQCRCNEVVREQSQDTPVGEIEDFSRHGTTFRMSPEHTKLNSPDSTSKMNTPGEDKDPQ